MRNNTTNTTIRTAVIENLEGREMLSASLLTVGQLMNHAGITMTQSTAEVLNVSKKAAPAHKKPAKQVKPAKPAKPAIKSATAKKTATTTTKTTTITTVTNPWTIAASQPVAAEPAAISGTTYKNFSNEPLFAANGPTQDDIRQGDVGDCYYLSTLAAIAKADPTRIEHSIEQMSDGTYVVQVFKGSTPNMFTSMANCRPGATCARRMPTSARAVRCGLRSWKRPSPWSALEPTAMPRSTAAG